MNFAVLRPRGTARSQRPDGSVPDSLWRAHESRAPERPYLYVLRRGRQTKVGVTANPKERAARLNGRLALVWHLHEQSFEIEQQIHEALHEHQGSVGETYWLDADEVARYVEHFLAPGSLRIPFDQWRGGAECSDPVHGFGSPRESGESRVW